MKKKLSLFIVLAVMFSVMAVFAQNPEKETLIDSRDGYVYEIVKMGSQWWMAENLTFDAGDGSWCYDDDPELCATYGRLYNWETAKNACPSGWHLPSDKEWQDLEKVLGIPDQVLDQMGWRSFITDLLYLEDQGMKIVMSGYRPHGDGAYDDGNDDAYFWTSTEKDSSDAWKRFLDDQRKQVGRGYDDKREGFSVRCVKD